MVDPGSSHKPFVFGAALEEGVITPDEVLVVGPSIRKGDQTFYDRARPFPEGTAITLPAAMAYSSNVATIMIADELGKETLYEYQQAFGLGKPTGVGMPGEAAGLLLPPAQWSGSSYGSVPIGHSVAATPVADGRRIRGDRQRRCVDAAPPGTGGRRRRRGGDPGRSAGHPAGTQPEHRCGPAEIMEAVVTVPDATGVGAAVESYRVAGKTGTGQLVVDGEYAPGEVASFIGMAPAESPRYVVAVFAHLAERRKRRRHLRVPGDDGLHVEALSDPALHDRTSGGQSPPVSAPVRRQAVRSSAVPGIESAARAATAPPRPARVPPCSLADLAARCGVTEPPAPRSSVTGVTHASTAVRPGDLYAALPGARHHGAEFVAQAAAAGAVAVLTDPAGAAAAAAAGLPALVVA